MAIAIDLRSAGANSAGASTISWTHTVGSGLSGGLLQVGTQTGAGAVVAISSVVWDNGGANTALSKTVNGVAATQIDGGNQVEGGWWWLASPASGAKTILVTAASSCELSAGSESVSGAAGTFNAASPQKAQFASNVNPSTTVTTASGEWVIDLIGGSFLTATDTPVVGAGQTQIHSHNQGAATSYGAGSDEAAVGVTTVMSWTGITTNTADSVQVSVSLLPAQSSSRVFQRGGRPFPFKPSGPRR